MRQSLFFYLIYVNYSGIIRVLDIIIHKKITFGEEYLILHNEIWLVAEKLITNESLKNKKGGYKERKESLSGRELLKKLKKEFPQVCPMEIMQ